MKKQRDNGMRTCKPSNCSFWKETIRRQIKIRTTKHRFKGIHFIYADSVEYFVLNYILATKRQLSCVHVHNVFLFNVALLNVQSN